MFHTLIHTQYIERYTHTPIHPHSECVRDVCSSPHDVYMFAAGFDNGTVQLWDVRYIEDCVSRTQAHDGACACVCVRVRKRSKKEWMCGCGEWLSYSGLDREIFLNGFLYLWFSFWIFTFQFLFVCWSFAHTICDVCPPKKLLHIFHFLTIHWISLSLPLPLPFSPSPLSRRPYLPY